MFDAAVRASSIKVRICCCRIENDLMAVDVFKLAIKRAADATELEKNIQNSALRRSPLTASNTEYYLPQ